MMKKPEALQFLEFTLELNQYRLTRSGERVHLTPKAMELLILLARNRPALMTKNELIDHLWPDVVVVPTNLRNLIAEIRGALGDRAEEIVRTVHSRGYSFTENAAEVASESQISGSPSVTLLQGRRRFTLWPGENLIGRGSECEMVIADDRVSRRHARLNVTTDGVWIEDLGSRNGTFVSNRQIDGPSPVSDGDEIGRFLATCGVGGLKIKDLNTGEVRSYELPETVTNPGFFDIEFSYDGEFVVGSGEGGVVVWQLDTGLGRHLGPGLIGGLAADDRTYYVGSFALNMSATAAGGTVRAINLDTGASTRIDTHGDVPVVAQLSIDGQKLISGDKNGILRVGPADGAQPQLLLGHDGWIQNIALVPDGEWIATAGEDATIRLWPMPDVTKPPLHTLPHDELLETLKSLTNLRVVEDTGSATGYAFEIGPFPGWEEVPEW